MTTRGNKPRGRRGRGRSGELTYYAPPALPEPAPEPPALRRDPMHGYTLADLDNMASGVVVHNMGWWPAGDRADQKALAWEGIAEHLCAADGQPSRGELMEAGRRALAREVRDSQRHHGARRDTTNDGSAFGSYWGWHSCPVPSPEGTVTDRVALTQILAALTRRQVQAFEALATCEDYVLAAQMLGVKPQTFRALIGRARTEFYGLWHEGEEPSRPYRADRRVTRRETGDPGELARRGAYAARRRQERRAA